MVNAVERHKISIEELRRIQAAKRAEVPAPPPTPPSVPRRIPERPTPPGVQRRIPEPPRYQPMPEKQVKGIREQ